MDTYDPSVNYAEKLESLGVGRRTSTGFVLGDADRRCVNCKAGQVPCIGVTPCKDILDREMPRHEWQHHDSAPGREIESMTADEHDNTAEWLVESPPVPGEHITEEKLRLARAQVHALLGVSKHLNEITSLLHDIKTELKED